MYGRLEEAERARLNVDLGAMPSGRIPAETLHALSQFFHIPTNPRFCRSLTRPDESNGWVYIRRRCCPINLFIDLIDNACRNVDSKSWRRLPAYLTTEEWGI